jgi:hypothetical protein
MKLGIFGLNVSAAGGLTKDPSRHELDWDQNVRLVQQAERAGFEAAIPFARWRGFEDEPTHTAATALDRFSRRLTVQPCKVRFARLV